MSYPSYFTPRGWRLEEGDPEALRKSVTDGTVSQTPEVKAAWQTIVDHLIAAVDLFNEMVASDIGVTQIVFQANPELDERAMRLILKVNQRSYGQIGPGPLVNNWAAIQAELDQITGIFSALVATDIGRTEVGLESTQSSPELMFKFVLVQRVPKEQKLLIPGEIHHLNEPARERSPGVFF